MPTKKIHAMGSKYSSQPRLALVKVRAYNLSARNSVERVRMQAMAATSPPEQFSARYAGSGSGELGVVAMIVLSPNLGSRV